MIFRLLTQLVLATSLLQVFPYDPSLIEPQNFLPQAGERVQVASVFAQELPVIKENIQAPVKNNPNSIGVVTSAVSAIVIDRATGKILYEKNPTESRSIGSITKLMTSLVFLEGDPNLEDQVSLQAADLRYGGRQHLQLNDKISILDLIHASLIGSDNSATAALARISGLSLGEFIARMNEKAASIGMQNTTFVDTTGLSPNNRSVVRDLAKLIDYSMKNSIIKASTEKEHIIIKGDSGINYSITSTNELLSSYINHSPYKIIGGKTGFLPEAGYCFGVVISEDGVHEIIDVVLGSYTKHSRFQDAKALASWVFKVYDWPDELSQN